MRSLLHLWSLSQEWTLLVAGELSPETRPTLAVQCYRTAPGSPVPAGNPLMWA